MRKKAQSGIVNFFMILVVGAILAIIGVMIFSKVDSSVVGLIPQDIKAITNESITINRILEDAGNSTYLAEDGYNENSETVVNGSEPFVTLIRIQDYIIRMSSNSGDLTNRGNITLINASGFNNSELFVSYTTTEASAAYDTTTVIENTVLDSFELGVIAFIIMAAAIILSAVFLFTKYGG